MKSRPTEAKPSCYVPYLYSLSQCFKIIRLSSTSVTTTVNHCYCVSISTNKRDQPVRIGGELEAVRDLLNPSFHG